MGGNMFMRPIIRPNHATGAKPNINKAPVKPSRNFATPSHQAIKPSHMKAEAIAHKYPVEINHKQLDKILEETHKAQNYTLNFLDFNEGKKERLNKDEAAKKVYLDSKYPRKPSKEDIDIPLKEAEINRLKISKY